jgi:hypothetical protein
VSAEHSEYEHRMDRWGCACSGKDMRYNRSWKSKRHPWVPDMVGYTRLRCSQNFVGEHVYNCCLDCPSILLKAENPKDHFAHEEGYFP